MIVVGSRWQKGSATKVVTVRFYGRLGEAIGREAELDPPCIPRDVRELRGYLATTYPAAAAELTSGSVKACVEDRIVPDDHPIEHGAVVEFFPPLSGG